MSALTALGTLLFVAASAQQPTEGHVWLGLDLRPLPLTGSDELEDFLRTAAVVSLTASPVGTAQPRITVLEQDGVRARAVFHSHHVVEDRQRLVDGSVIVNFRDSYTGQIAAWEVAGLLGVINMPPTVERELDGTVGSLQLWLEDARTESDRRQEELDFPDRERAWRQVFDMDVFDVLINNLDRTQGNFLWGRQSWDLWLIDHTRAFGADFEVLSPWKVRKCSRSLLAGLRSLRPEEVERVLGPYLNRQEQAALLARRDEILALIEQRIEANGESEVLFAWGGP